jgi:hypothetical protein
MTMWTQDEDEFFIGYSPPIPAGIARFVTRAILAIGIVATIWAGILAVGHTPPDGGMFEFGRSRQFTGTVVEQPYPAVRLDGSGGAEGVPLLVAPGKHGADALVRSLDGRRVTFSGTRIERGAHSMIEVDPPSFTAAEPPGGARTNDPEPLQRLTDDVVELTGEIVDSKCFLGVMVPGAGKTHKECASLCLRGGIPPALSVQDRSGHSSLLLLTGPRDESVRNAALDAAGEPIVVSGSVSRQGAWLVLWTDPRFWRRFGASAP